jgi:hypothetical protein
MPGDEKHYKQLFLRGPCIKPTGSKTRLPR